jgi:ABC-type antimicrobial peptide transport system permease subunit
MLRRTFLQTLPAGAAAMAAASADEVPVKLGFDTYSLRAFQWKFGITATDPLTYGTMAVAIAAIALLACAIPAWRAATLDPLVALRQD